MQHRPDGWAPVHSYADGAEATEGIAASSPVPVEYERRFIVRDCSILDGAPYVQIEQGYLWDRDGYAIRVRIVCGSTLEAAPERVGGADFAEFALKGPRANASRFELEQPLPVEIARDLVRLSEHKVVKRRYSINDGGNDWTIDEFFGDNAGLIIAEFESSEADVHQLVPPAWVGEEVTDDRRYDNEQLARHPIHTP